MLWALVVILVVLISGSIVIKVTFDSYMRVKNRALERRAMWLSRSGVKRTLTFLNTSGEILESFLNSKLSDTISSNEIISMTLHPWAGSILVVSIGRVGKVQIVASELIGQKSDLPDSVLIRTRSELHPLVLAGATSSPMTLPGTSGLPVRVTSVAGNPRAGLYQGRGPSQTVVDDWTYIDSVVPELDLWVANYELEELREFSKNMDFTYYGTQRFEGVDLAEILSSELMSVNGDLELVNCTLSVWESPVHIYATGTITLRENCRFEGNVKFSTRESFAIGGKSILDGVAVISDSTFTLSENSYTRANLLAGYTALIDDKATLLSGSCIVV
ncbi:MAG: hypothetical protein IIB00_07080 [candidate division Zixibacteria bacterium]|nr:hypothetical protein [candidate division Zixibacteria bacterium]